MVSSSKHTSLISKKPNNYINRLEAENRALREVIKAAAEGLQRIHRYAMLPKYQGFENRGINKSDILLRVEEIQSEMTKIEVENGL
jgi:hypothetical protein